MATATLVGCDSYLEVKPEDARTSEYFYSTPKEAQQALMGVYNGLLPISTYYLLLSDVRSDDTWLGVSSESETDYRALSNFRKYITAQSTISSAWTDYYEIVARANVFLDKVEELSFDGVTNGDKVKASFLAEARFLRAFAYFDLVRFYGRVPMVTHTQSVDEASVTPQSEAVDIYNNVIIPDLQYAVANMDSVAYTYAGEESAKGRATKVAAQALLGRVYWTMVGYPLYDESKKELAIEQLKAVLDYAGAFGDTPTRYWAKDNNEWMHIWISDNDNKYHIFEIQYIMQDGYGNPMIFTSLPKVSKTLSHFTMSGSTISSTASLRKLYQENSADYIRYHHTIRQTTGSNRYFEKFFENILKRDSLGYSNIDDQITTRTSFPINYPLIRLEDVMLMYADLVGPTTEGLGMVNKIRTRAGIAALDSTISSDDFAVQVLNERRRELAGEGIRWHDIVRTGHFVDYIKAAYSQESSSQSESVLDNVVEGMYIYPIPETQMLVRVGLYEQNEAYK